MEYLCGNDNRQLYKKVLPVYSEQVCDFLNSYSTAILRDSEAKTYPDVVTFAFWARKSNIRKKKEDYISRFDNQIHMGRGLVFHIAPSNVPVNCMFTYAFGLLAGNSNIVRIPSKEFPQINCMLRIMNDVIKEEEYKDIYNMTSFVRYDRSERACTEEFSSMCDVRVIWGGDNTIRDIRSIELPVRSTEITFADRYSFGIVDADTILEMSDEELDKLAEGFYNDTYLMDQNACSTPHLICFIKSGNKTCEDATDCVNAEAVSTECDQTDYARERFWTSVAKTAVKYDLADIKVSGKYADLCEMIMSDDNSSRNCIISEVKRYDNLLYVCKLDTIPSDVVNSCRGRYGLFYDCTINSLEDIAVLSDTKVQTCAVCGISEDKVRDYVINNSFRGIDRVVDFGKTLDIDVIWDGYDLIGSMSRIVN